jgi:hypothetical protein
MSAMKRVLVILVMALSLRATAQQSPSVGDRYESAVVDAKGQLRIATADGREILPAKEGDQVGFESVLISPDKKAVGWTALFPNCCTSYPIPLYLVLYSGGKVTKLEGSGLPVWQWRFLSGGKEVAFEQETVHGGWGVHEQVDDKESDRPDWVKAMGQVR